jgi:hypothetical protein
MSNTNKGFDDARRDARDAADKAKSAATSAAAGTMEKVKDTASNVMDKAKDTAANVADRAKDMASGAADTARDWASTAGRKAEDALGTVAGGMTSLAGTVRENAPREGMLGSAAGTVADALESGGRYLEQEGFSGIADDLTGMIRRNPIPAVLIGIGLGFLLARSTSRS